MASIEHRSTKNFTTIFAQRNVSGDAVLWRHNKSKMADGRHFEDR